MLVSFGLDPRSQGFSCFELVPVFMEKDWEALIYSESVMNIPKSLKYDDIFAFTIYDC